MSPSAVVCGTEFMGSSPGRVLQERAGQPSQASIAWYGQSA